MTSTTTAESLRPQRNIPADIARSWLLVNAMKTDLFDQSAVSRADAIILDIEDAVDPSQKDAARANVVNWLTAGGSAWVRINDATSPFWADDLAGLRGTPGLLGIMLAKTESADQVTESFHRMDGKTPVIPLVESAVGIEEANNIAKAQGAFRLAFGSGDFRRDTGMAATAEAMAYPRAKLVVASRVGNLPEIITDDVNGQLVESGDLAEWTRVLSRAAENPAATIDRSFSYCAEELTFISTDSLP